MIRTLLAACAVGLAFYSCKKDDTSAPFIMIMQPLDGTTFHYGSSIPISAHLTDDRELSTIHIAITNSSNQEVLQTINYVDAGTEKHVGTSIYHGDLYLPSGTYHVKITASDGHNEMNAFREINLIEAPLVLLKRCILHQTSLTTSSIDSLNNGGSVPFAFPTINYGVGAYDSRFGFLAFGNNTNNALVTFNSDMNWVQGSPPLASSNVNNFFNCAWLDKETHDVYFGVEQEKIWSMDRFGSHSLFCTIDYNTSARRIITTSNYLFAYIRNIQGTVQNISVFNKATGAFIQSTDIPMSYEVRGIAALNGEDKILIAGNEDGECVLRYYNNETNFLNDVFTFYNTSPCTNVWPAGADHFVISHEDGLVRYTTSLDNSAPGLFFNPVAVSYEKISQQLYVVAADGLHILNADASQELDFLAMTNIRDVLLMYNK